MKTKEEVLSFLTDQSNCGNQIIAAYIGNGGSGLDISSLDISPDLENMDFDGKVDPCEDIRSWSEYDSQFYTTYQFSDENGLIVQVLTW
jgi:hypothetical protein